MKLFLNIKAKLVILLILSTYQVITGFAKKILLNTFEHDGSVKIKAAVHKFQAQFSGVFRATRGDILKRVTLGTRMG